MSNTTHYWTPKPNSPFFVACGRHRKKGEFDANKDLAEVDCPLCRKAAKLRPAQNSVEKP